MLSLPTTKWARSNSRPVSAVPLFQLSGALGNCLPIFKTPELMTLAKAPPAVGDGYWPGPPPGAQVG